MKIVFSGVSCAFKHVLPRLSVSNSDGRDCVDDALFPCFLECKGPSQFQCMSTKRSRKQTVENSYSVGLDKRGPARHPAFLSCFHICCMCV